MIAADRGLDEQLHRPLELVPNRRSHLERDRRHALGHRPRRLAGSARVLLHAGGVDTRKQHNGERYDTDNESRDGHAEHAGPNSGRAASTGRPTPHAN
jgi:hypothetical protein